MKRYRSSVLAQYFGFKLTVMQPKKTGASTGGSRTTTKSRTSTTEPNTSSENESATKDAEVLGRVLARRLGAHVIVALKRVGVYDLRVGLEDRNAP